MRRSFLPFKKVQEKEHRRWMLAVAALTVLGAILRAYHLGLDSYWLDEATSIAIARSSWADIWNNVGQTSKPPLFYFLLKLWLPLGESEGTTRLLTLLWGTLSVPAQYYLGQTLADRRVGLLSAALLALSPFHMAYSQELRMYTLQGLLLTLTIGFLLRGLGEGRTVHWIAFAVTATLSAYTHYFSLYTLLFLGLYGLWKRRDRRTVMALGLSALVVALVLLPQIGHLLGEVARETSEGYPPPTVLTPLTTLYFLLLSYTMPPQLFLPAMFATLGTLALVVYESVRRSAPTTRQGMLLWMTFGPLVAVYVMAAFFPLFLPERTLIIILPTLLVLLAQGFIHRPRLSTVPVMLILLAIASLISLGNYYWTPNYRKPPMREAAAYVIENFEPGDAVLHTGDGSYITFLAYPHPTAHFLLRGDPLPRKEESVYPIWEGTVVEADEFAGQYRRLWLVVALDHSIEFQKEAKASFDKAYPLLEQTDFAGIGVLAYDLGQ